MPWAKKTFLPKILNILKTNEIAERPGEVHGLWVRVAARQLGVLDVPHQEQGGAEPADDRSGGGTTSSGAIYNLSWHKPKSIYIMLRNAFKRIITKPHRLNYLWTLLTSLLLLPGRPTSSSHRLLIVELYVTIHNDDAKSEIKDKSDQSHISEPAERT